MINNNFRIKSDSEDNIRSEKNRPSKAPNKDFQKVLSKDDQEKDEESPSKDIAKEDKSLKTKEFQAEIEKPLENEASQTTKGVSLFDLAASPETPITEIDKVLKTEEASFGLPEDVQKGSVHAFINEYGQKKEERLNRPLISQTEISSELYENKNSQKTLQKPSNLEDDQTNPLLSIFTLAPQTTAPILHPTERLSVSHAHIKEMIDQIIAKLYTIETKGKTDTLITLKHPPLFAGSSVVITSFNTAKGEFNITFENLTQAAKAILDRIENQNALISALDQKGYTVHIITATTLAETQNLVEGKTRYDQSKEDNESESRRKKGQERQEKNE